MKSNPGRASLEGIIEMQMALSPVVGTEYIQGLRYRKRIKWQEAHSIYRLLDTFSYGRFNVSNIMWMS